MCCCAASAVVAQEPSNPSLSRAIEYYRRLNYEACVQQLDKASQQKNTTHERIEIATYAGLCHFNLNHTSEARTHFEMALRLNREAQLPPYSPPRAVALFRQVFHTLPPPAMDAPKNTELTPAPKLEPPPIVVAEPEAKPSRAVPLVLGSASVASAIAGGVVIARAFELARSANNEPFESRAIALGNEARLHATISYVLFGVAGALASSAIATFAVSEINANRDRLTDSR